MKENIRKVFEEYFSEKTTAESKVIIAVWEGIK